MKQYTITHYSDAFNAYAEKYGTEAARAKFYDLVTSASAKARHGCSLTTMAINIFSHIAPS